MDNKDSNLTPFLDNNIEEEISKNIEFYSGQAAAPDSGVIESLMHFHLQQSFLLNGLDFVIIDKTRDLKPYDYFVVHKKTNFLFAVQAKSSSSFDRNGRRVKNSKTLRTNPNSFIIKMSLEDLAKKYKDIPVFALYCGTTHPTNFGPEYRYKIYLATRTDLINYMKTTQCKSELKIHTGSDFWISRNGNYKIFDNYYNVIDDITNQLTSQLTNQLEESVVNHG